MADMQVIHHGKATLFADPNDLVQFKKALAAGKSSKQALHDGDGDNGIGYWKDNTTLPTCQVAVIPEDIKEKCGSVDWSQQACSGDLRSKDYRGARH